MAELRPESRAWGRSLTFWTRFALIWMMVITVTGAAVRLTGSGLGCTDWPTCNVNTELDAPAFHSAIEFGNRVISGLAIIPVIGAWFAARRGGRSGLRPWFYAIIGGFIGQVLLGMLVTRTELDPRVVLGHFLLSIVLIYLAAMLDHRARDHFADPDRRAAFANLSLESSRTLWRLSQLTLALAATVIVVGTLVTGSGPHTGSDESGHPVPRLGFDIREITQTHGALVWVLGATLLGSIIVARRANAPHLTWLLRLILLGIAQGAVGYIQYFTGVPALLVGVHIAGAVLLWTGMVWYAAHASMLHAVHIPVPDDAVPEPAR